MVKIIKKSNNIIKKPLSLEEFYNKRNNILIWHDKGGLGDVLMQRMLFEDFKFICPNINFTFACLPEYMDVAKDHPDIFNVIDSRTVNLNDYCIHYNTCVTIADRYENYYAPCPEHRSDIWAKYCGVTLENHNMQFKFEDGFLKNCRNKLEKITGNDKPIVLFCPVSKMIVKTLLPFQIKAIVNATKDYSLIGLHNREINDLTQLNIPGVYKATLKEWMGYLAVSDYIISVDTAAFHMASGLKKPLLGIFTFADGKAYGKYSDFILVQKHRDNGNWDCGPCFKFGDCPKCNKAQKPCLTELTEKELTDGVKAMFLRWPYVKTEFK